MLDADEALALGLVATVVPDDDVVEQAHALAQRLADGPTRALGRTKRLLRAEDRGLAAQLDAEADAIAESAARRRGPGGHRRVPRAPPAAVPVGPELSERGVR